MPGGLRFYIPALKWKSPRNASFNQIVDALQRVLSANPGVAQKLGWSLEWNALADRVDEFNARICAAQGWDNFILADESATIPKSEPPQQAKAFQSLRAAAAEAKELLAGAKSLIEWVASGEQPVHPGLAEHRAIVCSLCPLNEPGDFTKWFTVPAAALIQRQVEEAQTRKLTTPRDEQLNLCTACHCPLKLKVHVPIAYIVKRLTVEQMEKLKGGRQCWILSEKERAGAVQRAD